LRISSATQTPAQISALLGRQATHAGIKGEPRGRRRHDEGEVVDPAAARWETHYWCADFDEAEDVEGRVRAIAALLSRKKLEVSAIVAGGGAMNVYAFISPVRGLGIEIEPGLMMTLASFGVTLGIEIHLETWQRVSREGE
jgi:hypothetical protein